MMDDGTSRDYGGCGLDGDATPGPTVVGDFFLVWR